MQFFVHLVIGFLKFCDVLLMFICILYIIFSVFYHYGGSFICFVYYNVFVCCQFFKCSCGGICMVSSAMKNTPYSFLVTHSILTFRPPRWLMDHKCVHIFASDVSDMNSTELCQLPMFLPREHAFSSLAAELCDIYNTSTLKCTHSSTCFSLP